MGEQVKQEEAPAAAEVTKPEEKPEEAVKPPPPAEEEKKAEEAKPPSPCVLYVDLHCVGCAKKIERSLMRLRGVEGVDMDMDQNQVTVKGIVEPQAVCNKIMKKTRRMTKVLSPLPEAEGEPVPQVVASQVSAPTTVELNVNMHCEACAEQLKKKILKMRGVQTAQTEFSTGKVMVTGTMDANKLVDYVYRRTKKKAQIVPQPEPELPPPAEEEKKEEKDQKPAAEGDPKPQENDHKPPDGEKPTEEANGEGDKPPEGTGAVVGPAQTQEPMPPPPIDRFGGGGGQVMINHYDHHEESMRRMMYYYHPPMYVIERIPPPQLFSDENPNACCIS